jgi:hypothetical protein
MDMFFIASLTTLASVLIWIFFSSYFFMKLMWRINGLTTRNCVPVSDSTISVSREFYTGDSHTVLGLTREG